MTTDAALVAAAVRAEAARKGLSQRALAKQLGWEPTLLQRRMAGHVSFRADELRAIAKQLGVPPSRFIDDDEAA
jgi:transcriptional regulator with XRE-family HTH domain